MHAQKLGVNDRFVYATLTQIQIGMNDKPSVTCFFSSNNLLHSRKLFSLFGMSIVYSIQDSKIAVYFTFGETLLSFYILKGDFSPCILF